MNKAPTEKFSTHESDDGIVFQIDSGAYAGLRYQYGTVSIKEPDLDATEAVLKFTYKIVEDPTAEAGLDENLIDLQVTMGNILADVISGQEDGDVVETVESYDLSDLDVVNGILDIPEEDLL